MAYSIVTPSASFIRFDGENPTHCIWGENNLCLPVYAEDDIAFQFVIQASTVEEADALCMPYEAGIAVGIVLDCDQAEFTVEFEELPERYRISDLQVLYNWSHGLPGMIGNILPEECFYIRVRLLDETNFCSNCFQRIPEDCFTSVIEYGNNDNFAGFNYCNSGAIDSEETSCDPEIYEFNNISTLTIPYTSSLQDRFGTVPTIQVWIYIDGVLTNVGVVATFDAMPPTQIYIDMGGVSSGIVIIR